MLKKFIFTIALLLPLLTMAQESPSVVVGPVTKQQKEADKKKAKIRQKAEKEHQKEIKQHYKNQDKATRKRMKKSRKEADRINHHKKKGFFLTRWMK